MKHIFIINQNAGLKHRTALLSAISDACEREKADFEIFYTDRPRAAEDFVRERSADGGSYRFYACGGDGTLSEVANGAFGFENVEVAVIPSGTGNDFVRNFSNSEFFTDITRQLRGKLRTFDLIRINDRFAVNTVNIGFDCSVVSLLEKMRGKRLLKLFRSYTVSAFIKMITMPKSTLTFHHGGSASTRRFTLCAIGNGRFCGGGYKSNPKALLDDGKFDVFEANSKVGRLLFLRILGKYRAGVLVGDPKYDKYITYTVTDELSLEGKTPFEYCVDGEVMEASSVNLSVCRNALRFVIPDGSALCAD